VKGERMMTGLTAERRESAEDAQEERLRELSAFSDEQLATLDIALVNLLCAAGLPGAAELTISRYVDWLDDAAQKVELATQRNYGKFLDNPATYNDSQATFCIVCMIEVLQKELGVRYNPKWQGVTPHQPVPKDFGRDAGDLFVHPIMDGVGGTCGSLPILYVAVGRRLGYPLKVVKATQHLFVRWDDPDGTHWHAPERFNIEASGRGVHLLPDEHYRTWPRAVPQEDIDAGIYLQSLSPREELAEFLATRGFVCLAHNRLKAALDSFSKAAELAHHNYHFAKWRDYAAAKRTLLMRHGDSLNAASPLETEYPHKPFWTQTPMGQRLLVQIPQPERHHDMGALFHLGISYVVESLVLPTGERVDAVLPRQGSGSVWHAAWVRLADGRFALVHEEHKPSPFAFHLQVHGAGCPARPPMECEALHAANSVPSHAWSIRTVIENAVASQNVIGEQLLLLAARPDAMLLPGPYEPRLHHSKGLLAT